MQRLTSRLQLWNSKLSPKSPCYFGSTPGGDSEGRKVKPPHHNKMGKSNKFDYTNRNNAGAKLGKIIGDAAVKEAEKLKKDAAKPTARGRKVSMGSFSGGMEGEERSTVHLIDLKAPGKQLGDDGISAMVEGLEVALHTGTPEASLALEDLNLDDNGLTVASLAKLATIVDMAKNDLKTLVISNNAIEVTNDEQARDFKTFIRAFKDCKRVRRLDLSGNVGLGPRALEVLARVHTSEPAITPIDPSGEREVYTLPEEQSSSIDAAIADESHDNHSIADRMTAGVVLQRRCGLRSIPYINLQGIGMNEAGALWLSYVLEDHYQPNQLTNEINAPPGTTTVAAYQQDTIDTGINWRENDKSLGRDGLHILKKTEDVRRHSIVDDAGSLLTNASDVFGSISTSSPRFSRESLGHRRTSIRSVHTDDGGEHEATEMESLRKRLQRHVIEASGTKGVELWSTALAVVATSRKLALLAPISRKQYVLPHLFPHNTTPKPQVRTKRLDSATDTQQAIDTIFPLPTQPPHPEPRSYGKSYAATLAARSTAAPGEPEFVLTDVSNTPETPKLTFRAHRKGTISDGSDINTLSEKLSAVETASRKGFSERCVEYQERTARYRDTSAAGHLPMAVFERIFGYVSAGGMGLLSHEQKAAAYAWGQKRETLVMERSWMKMTESAQVWMLLDGTGTLAYAGPE